MAGIKIEHALNSNQLKTLTGALKRHAEALDRNTQAVESVCDALAQGILFQPPIEVPGGANATPAESAPAPQAAAEPVAQQ